MTGFGRLAAMLIAVLILAAPARAADVEILKDAARIARICLDNLPDARAVTEGFKKAGMRPEGRFGDYYFYSKSGYRIFAGGPGKLMQDRTPECMILVDKMTVTEAQILMLPWVQAIEGGQIGKPYPERDMVVAFGGKLRGHAAMAAVYQNLDVYYARGAAILLTLK